MQKEKIHLGHRRVLPSNNVHFDDHGVYNFGDHFPYTTSWPRRRNSVTKKGTAT